MNAQQNSWKQIKQLIPYTDLRSIFSFRQWLNNFAKIEDNSDLRFISAATGILSRLVALIDSRFLSLETYWVKTVISQSLCVMKSGRGWIWSSRVEFEVKFVAKSLALSYEDDVISEVFIIVGTDDLPLLNLLVILQNSWEPSLSFSKLA